MLSRRVDRPEFPRWPFTARVNASLGRPGVDDEDSRLASASAFAGADELVAGLPEGWETLLAREFQGGTNLSGGQWQRLALAQAHFRDAQILICDEPTVALDPTTEIEAFDRLMALADDGQTVLLITHRLGSIRYADRIYVLDSGKFAGEIEDANSLAQSRAVCIEFQALGSAGESASATSAVRPVETTLPLTLVLRAR